jgi:hypothetical protein
MAEAIDMVDGHAASALYRCTQLKDPMEREEAVRRFWATMQAHADEVNRARSS